VGRAVAAVRELDGGQRGIDARPDGIRRNAAVLEAERDLVAGAGHHDLRLGILEEQTTPIARDPRLQPVDEQRPLGLDRRRVVEPGDRGQQGRLAGAGRAEEKHTLAGLDHEVDAPKGPRATPGVTDAPSVSDDGGRRTATGHGAPDAQDGVQTRGWSRPTANSRSTPVLTSARTSSHAPTPATSAPLAIEAIPYTSHTSAPAPT
jgi:hypothetical protein